MEINSQLSEVTTSGLENIQSFGIKTSAAAFNLLSSALYTNKIKAVLREIGCNAVDAHAMNGNQKVPIEVKIPNRLDSQFYIRDFGPGLSEEQVLSLYSTYFDSTKQKSNDFIGGFGVGSKSPFAYTDTFTVESIQDGIKKIYIAFVNEEGVPSISKVDSSNTDQPNGISVGFPVKPEDLNAFTKEALDVYSSFKVKPTILGTTIDFAKVSELKIGDDFEVKNLSKNGIHINMGGVEYPLGDYLMKAREAGIKLNQLTDILASVRVYSGWQSDKYLSINLPIGTCSVAASREYLQFDKKTLNSLNIELEKKTKELVNLLKNQLLPFLNDTPVKNATALKAFFDAQPPSYLNIVQHFMNSADFNPDQISSIKIAVSSIFNIDSKLLNIATISTDFKNRLKDIKSKIDISKKSERQKLYASIKRAISNYAHVANHNKFLRGNQSVSGNDKQLLPFKLDKQTMYYSMEPLNQELVLKMFLSRKYDYTVFPLHALDTKDKKEAYLKEIDDIRKKYPIEFEILPDLPALDVESKLKAKTEDYIACVSLDTLNTIGRYDTDEFRKIINSLARTNYAQKLPLTSIIDTKIGYVVYDRSGDKSKNINSTDLYTKYIALHDYSHSTTRAIRKEYDIPEAIVFVDKKDIDQFKKIYPNSVEMESTFNNLKSTTLFQEKLDQWINNRPNYAVLDRYQSSILNTFNELKNQYPDIKLAGEELVDKFKSLNRDNFDINNDRELIKFFSKFNDTQYPDLTVVDLGQQVEKLKEMYPLYDNIRSNYSYGADKIALSYIKDMSELIHLREIVKGLEHNQTLEDSSPSI